MFKLLVLCACVAGALAAVALAPLETKPDKYKNEEGCYISELDKVIPLGSKAPSKSGCKAYQCQEAHVQWISCGAVAPRPGCSVVSDSSKPYPGCCPTLKC